MKTLEFNIKAHEVARKLLLEARRNEPEITKELKSVAFLTKGRMVGLSNKFKDENSLAEKLRTRSARWGNSIEKEAKRNNDTLRYTIIFSSVNYQNGYHAVLTKLESNGFKIGKVWNSWEMEGGEFDTGYRGINTTIISSHRQKFELQFHTAKSFQVKMRTHGLYEEIRKPTISVERKVEIRQIMLAESVKIKRPKGV